jgi:triacylglycerol esterase/lipase EstA (alpha/beta hydrolase family)
MIVVFVHGWGVRNPDYRALPERLRQAIGAATVDVWLSDYISYSDSVTMSDLAVAFERARQANFPAAKFACVTHSTGGPILRTWLDMFCRQSECWLTHLIMLAPPNHGSALAQLGKSRLARMKLWFEHMQPGEQILDWLYSLQLLSQSDSRPLPPSHSWPSRVNPAFPKVDFIR